MKTIFKIMLLTGGVVVVGYYLNKKGYISIKNGNVSTPDLKNILPGGPSAPIKPRIPDKKIKFTPDFRHGGNPKPTQQAI